MVRPPRGFGDVVHEFVKEEPAVGLDLVESKKPSIDIFPIDKLVNEDLATGSEMMTSATEAPTMLYGDSGGQEDGPTVITCRFSHTISVVTTLVRLLG